MEWKADYKMNCFYCWLTLPFSIYCLRSFFSNQMWQISSNSKVDVMSDLSFQPFWPLYTHFPSRDDHRHHVFCTLLEIVCVCGNLLEPVCLSLNFTWMKVHSTCCSTFCLFFFFNPTIFSGCSFQLLYVAVIHSFKYYIECSVYVTHPLLMGT